MFAGTSVPAADHRRYDPATHAYQQPGGPMTDSPQGPEPSGAERMFGDFAPGLVHFTDEVLFAEVWERTELSVKDGSLVTVAALTTAGNTDQLVFHLDFAKQ